MRLKTHCENGRQLRKHIFIEMGIETEKTEDFLVFKQIISVLHNLPLSAGLQDKVHVK